ncbi:MAG: (2Fe-2S)-binding protein, partial [Actinomycetota bacterium]
MTITLTINGAARTLECEPHESLRTVLRRAGLHSVRFGSATGETGAAAVLVDGRLISADVMLAAQADGHAIETIEGMSTPGTMHPIQQAFIDTGAIQSGYSTPATVLAAKALIGRNPEPTEEEIRDVFSGILDRETGYLRPVHAVLRAAAVLRGDDPDDIGVAHLDALAEGGPGDDIDLSPIAP